MKNIKIVYRSSKYGKMTEVYFSTSEEVRFYLKSVMTDEDTILFVTVDNACVYSSLAHKTIRMTELYSFFFELEG